MTTPLAYSVIFWLNWTDDRFFSFLQVDAEKVVVPRAIVGTFAPQDALPAASNDAEAGPAELERGAGVRFTNC
jgi:hypothetical protein